MNEMPYKWTFHARLRYKHLIHKPEFDKFRDVIQTKLIEYGSTGMSLRKVRYYQKHLQL